MWKECQTLALSSISWLRASIRSVSCVRGASGGKRSPFKCSKIPLSPSIHKYYPVMESIPVLELSHQAVEDIVSEPVASFHISEGSNKGDNVSSDLYRLRVELKSGGTKHLVYKKFPTSTEQRHFSVSSEIFWRERILYSDIIPRIKTVLEEAVAGETGRSHAKKFEQLFPKYVAGFNDDENDFICLEDLRPGGFKMPDKNPGLSWEETKLAMEATGRFHGYSYVWLSKEPEGVWESSRGLKRFLRKHWIVPNNKDTVELTQIQTFLAANYANMIDLMKKHGEGSDVVELVEKMSEPELMERTQEIMARTTDGTDTKYFPLLIHGDLWGNNLLYRYDKEGKAEEVKFLDLQHSRRGNIYEDLSYFVYTSTSPRMRAQFPVEKILEEYYAAFSKVLSDFQVSPPESWSKETLLKEFKENDLPTFLFSSFFLPLQLGKDAENGIVAERDFAEELVNKMERSPVALRRLEDIVREAATAGVI